MTDTPHIPDMIDPARPWITDERDAPQSMSWWGTFFNPMGRSSRVHFTRALTVLFFIQLFPGFILATGGGGNAMQWLTVVALISIISMIIHMRRLTDAGRASWLATVVFAPVFAGMIMFTYSASGHIDEANNKLALYERVQSEPDFAKEERAKRTALEKTIKDIKGERGKKLSGAERQALGTAMKEKAELDIILRETFSPKAYVQGLASPSAGMVWALLALPIFLWSILWVAQKPTDDGHAEGLRDYQIGA